MSSSTDAALLGAAEAAEAAEREAMLQLEGILGARREMWVAGGGLVDLRPTAAYDDLSPPATDASAPDAAAAAAAADPDPEVDPEGWLSHPGAVRRHLARTHGSLRGLFRRHHKRKAGAEEANPPSGSAGSLSSRGGPLVRVPDFLPAGVARWAFNALQALDERVWEPTGVEGSSRFKSTSNQAPEWVGGGNMALPVLFS